MLRPLRRLIRRLQYGRPIVVVSGLPRSGTSLMMQMLHAGGLPILSDGIRTPDASNPRGYFELEAVKELEKGTGATWLADARGKAVKIVSPLLRWLPQSYNYQVILVERDLDEVIASQNRMLAARGAPHDQAQDERVRLRYQEIGEQTRRMLQQRACFSTLVVDYGRTIADPEETARRIDRFLGRKLDVTRMAAVRDSALYRNRRSGT